jgi:hypothetical protein
VTDFKASNLRFHEVRRFVIEQIQHHRQQQHRE